MDLRKLRTDHAEWQSFVGQWHDSLADKSGVELDIKKVEHLPVATRKMHNSFTLEENIWYCALKYDAFSELPELLKLKIPMLTLCKGDNASSLQGIIKRKTKGYSAATAASIFGQFLEEYQQIGAKDKDGNNISTHLILAYHQAKDDGSGGNWEHLTQFMHAYLNVGGCIDVPNKDGKDTLMQCVEMGYDGVLAVCVGHAKSLKPQLDKNGESFVSLLVNKLTFFRETIYENNALLETFSSFALILTILANVSQREELSPLFFTPNKQGVVPVEALFKIIFDPNIIQSNTREPVSVLRDFHLRQQTSNTAKNTRPKV